MSGQKGEKRLILVIEDEKSITDILDFHLRRAGYEVLIAADGAKGLRLAQEKSPDLLLLDVMLPQMDGFTICRTLRDENNLVPIVMLTAREDEDDRVTGLDLGADDYITKPFYMKELLARVAANLRRTNLKPEEAEPEPASETLRYGGLILRTGNMEVTAEGTPVELSQREFDLLCYLMKRAGTVITREDLMREVWNYDFMGDLRVVDVAVRRLREKIEPVPAEPTYIITKRGVGYLFRGEIDH